MLIAPRIPPCRSPIRLRQAGYFCLLPLWTHDLRPQQILSPRPLMVRNVSRFASGVNEGSGIMSAYAGAQRTEDAIGAAEERGSLQWAHRTIEEIKAGLRNDPS